MSDDILLKVKNIIVETIGGDVDAISPSTNIYRDLGADSLDAVEILMGMEDEFDGEFTDEQVEGLETVEQIVSFIQTHVSKNAAVD